MFHSEPSNTSHSATPKVSLAVRVSTFLLLTVLTVVPVLRFYLSGGNIPSPPLGGGGTTGETGTPSEVTPVIPPQPDRDWRENGVNLFNASFETGGIDNDGAETDEGMRVRSGYLSVSPASVYTLSVENFGEPFITSYIYEYDRTGSFLRCTKTVETISPVTFVTTADTAYLRVQSMKSRYATLENAVYAGYWLEEGTVSTPWTYLILSKYTTDVPANQGVQNVLDRLRIFSGSVLTMSGSGLAVGYHDPNRAGLVNPYKTLHLKEGSLLYGFPYSSVRKTDTYIGQEVSLDSFLTALANPASILYTSDYSDPKDPGYSPFIQYAWIPYGTVCSTVVGYALNLGIRYSTYEWSSIPGMKKIDPETEGIALCDVVCNVTSEDRSGGHMAIISNILRREDGSIYMIELTEAGVTCVSSAYITYEYFTKVYLQTFSIYRYDGIDSVPPCESKLIGTEINAALGLDRGDLSVYRLGDTVGINLMTDVEGTLTVDFSSNKDQTSETVRIFSSGEAENTNINGVSCRLFSFVPDRCGYYRVTFCSGDGNPRGTVSFAVARSGNLTYENGLTERTVGRGETFRIVFEGEQGCRPLYVCIETRNYVTRIQRFLTKDEIADGVAELVSEQTGNMYVKVYYTNEYGRIVSERLLLTVTE